MKLVGERRALASIIFAFYFLFYFLTTFIGLIDPEMEKANYAIAGVYGLAFFSLVAGYFWARWYAVGVGLYGVIVAVVGLWTLRDHPQYDDIRRILLFVGTTHFIAAVGLWGSAMSGPYDGQTAWREKFHMDENAVQRLGRSVIRAGVSLPLVLVYALAPRDGAALAGALAALALTGLGLRGLVQLKTWGVLALGAAGAILVAQSGVQVVAHGLTTTMIAPALGGVLLLAAAAPFAAPVARWIRSSGRATV